MEHRELNPCTMLNPTPVVIVSCGNAAGEQNMITVAWTGTVNSEPPMISISVRPERYSYHIIKESGEFVVNLADEKMCHAVDFCGVKSGKDTDKALETGLHYKKTEKMDYTPYIAEAPVCICCKLKQTISLGSHDMMIGKIISVQVREDLLDANGSLHLEKAKLICYNHGLYQKLGDVMGFFGYSVAKKEIFQKRMKAYR